MMWHASLGIFILGLSLTGNLAHAMGSAPQSLQSVDIVTEAATSSLEKEIITLDSGLYLAAGQNQFHSLWTRDFAYSVRGLLAIGRIDVVKSHLTHVISARRTTDSLVPRVIDNVPPRWRVIAAVFFHIFGVQDTLPLGDPLTPEYVDEHGTEAIDSNAAILLGALDYYRDSHDQAWWDENEKALIEIFHYYDGKLDPTTGLITQGDYADWQDSVKRPGTAFYTNFLYTLVMKEFAEFPDFGIAPDRWLAQKALLNQYFYDTESGLYRAIVGQPYFCLDANLLAIDRGFFSNDPENATKLYQALKASPFWQRSGTPGWNTYPDYPSGWWSEAVSLVGLGHYHDELYWSWLMAYSAKVAKDMGDIDEAHRIFTVMEGLITRDKAVAEIYNNKPGFPVWDSWLFRADSPFSWGSAAVLEYLYAR